MKPRILAAGVILGVAAFADAAGILRVLNQQGCEPHFISPDAMAVKCDVPKVIRGQSF